MISSFYWHILFPSMKLRKLHISTPIDMATFDMEVANIGHLGTSGLEIIAGEGELRHFLNHK